MKASVYPNEVSILLRFPLYFPSNIPKQNDKLWIFSRINISLMGMTNGSSPF
jgi:hypothetical protein